MKKLIITTFVFLMSAGFIHAQDYNTGIGLRGGLSNGLTIKHFIGQKSALEGIFTTRWSGVNITGLYELHQEAFDVERLKFYYGAGGHIGFWSGSNVTWANDSDDYMVIGIDGIIGLEYSFTEVPLNIGVDWKPAFNLVGNTEFWPDGGAVSIRYIF